MSVRKWPLAVYERSAVNQHSHRTEECPDSDTLTHDLVRAGEDLACPREKGKPPLDMPQGWSDCVSPRSPSHLAIVPIEVHDANGSATVSRDTIQVVYEETTITESRGWVHL